MDSLLLGATAAYAAVLVVFVGTSITPNTSTKVQMDDAVDDLGENSTAEPIVVLGGGPEILVDYRVHCQGQLTKETNDYDARREGCM